MSHYTVTVAYPLHFFYTLRSQPAWLACHFSYLSYTLSPAIASLSWFHVIKPSLPSSVYFRLWTTTIVWSSVQPCVHPIIPGPKFSKKMLRETGVSYIVAHIVVGQDPHFDTVWNLYFESIWYVIASVYENDSDAVGHPENRFLSVLISTKAGCGEHQIWHTLKLTFIVVSSAEFRAER